MVFKRFYVQIVIRITLILAFCLWFGFEFHDPPNFYTIIFLGLLIIIQVLLLIRYVNRTNRELSKFFISLKDKDSSLRLSPDDQYGTFRELADILQETADMLKDARIEKEKQYRYLQFIIEHVDIGLLSFQQDGRIIHYNPAARKMLRMERVTGLESLNTIYPEFKQILLDLAPGRSTMIRISLGDEMLQLLIRSTDFIFEKDKLRLISFQDVKQEMDAQELLSWQRLIKVLNHEVMNSLTPIRTLTHAIRRSVAELKPGKDNVTFDHSLFADILKNANLIEERSTNLVNFIKQYRDITKIEKISPETVPVRGLFTQITGFLKEELAQKNITCEVSVTPENLEILCDPSLVEQLLINLLINAIEALNGCSGPVIRLRAFLQENSHVMVQVSDNGVGIPADKSDEIFTPFYSTKKGGTGIGLSFARQVMRLHGGNISVQSVPGKETVFTLVF
ncbi:MAG: hypothetical protein AMS27_04410 [Bacteroides sp. SM23_62_1]|nr:MAG: hypothetical protein AMS27_04410 [Bacteroides sp. SM23_62_1]